MADNARNDSRPCSIQCKADYSDCMKRREHTSVCRMKFVQCNCGCSID